ncbi:hypothetical protein ABEB36_005160, partial [Hypothenemus hampei]
MMRYIIYITPFRAVDENSHHPHHHHTSSIIIRGTVNSKLDGASGPKTTTHADSLECSSFRKPQTMK